ncbi:hypothetical protein [Erwinia sorbitola]|uniref:Uncharacterized protein n=1 Tax=Erwinia sorbitola TaxID=2681984 RepID=A0A6I6EM73_9GAMM|nr:hypothetical protein [Erwinia sorbitola]QGU89255.1 hypothetical protein GN242_19435 [Erwinia sorbitola]
MKLINQLKNNRNVNLNTLLALVILCIISVFLITMTGCLLGRAIAFFKTDILTFDWKKDILYSVKVGTSAGMLSGIGIWIKARLQEHKHSKKTNQ